jgi:DnaK suppressor protein
MNKRVLTAIEKKLTEKRDQILHLINKEEGGEIAEVESENVIGDIVDTANVALEQQILSKLDENELKKLHEVTEALKRIEEGVYGKCVSCGKDIEEKRLVAIPEAKKCIACKALEEKRRVQ